MTSSLSEVLVTPTNSLMARQPEIAPVRNHHASASNINHSENVCSVNFPNKMYLLNQV